MAEVAELVEEVEVDDREEVKLRCGDDLKYLYQQILLDGNVEFQESIEGLLHDLLFDFLRWEELGNGYTASQTNLPSMIPEQGQTRWIYWPDINAEPIVYDGDEHELGEKWKKGDLIKGIIVRIAGDGHNKYVLLPRFHLKTEIAHVARSLQDIIRDPSIRLMSKTHVRELAEEVLGRIKDAWNLEKFNRYFGSLKPEFKEQAWNERAIQVLAPRRGVGHTVEASAVDVGTVGKHPNGITMDDVIGFENLSKKEKVKAHVRTLAFLLGGEGFVVANGTRYAPDDPHGLYLDYGTPLFGSTSFIFATLTDEVGNSTWKYMTDERIQRLRERCDDDYMWYCQMYNNPFQVESQKLKPEWWRQWPREEDRAACEQYMVDDKLAPEAIAEALRLDICITLDPASSTRKRSDCSACIVQGQTQDREFRYVLGGFREKLSKDELPDRFVDVVEHWHKLCRRIRTRFVVGVESHGLGTYLQWPLKHTMRTRGFEQEIVELKSQNKHKNDRIYRLASPYRLGTVLFPESLPVDNYDLVEVLKQQFMHFPRGGDGEDDLLDAQAYQEDLLIAKPITTKDKEPIQKARANDVLEPKEPTKELQGRSGKYTPRMRNTSRSNGRWTPTRFRNG